MRGTPAIDLKFLDRADLPVRRFVAGQTILAEGEAAREMFVVRKGFADITVGGETVERIGPGGIFGEMALIDHAPRSALVVAGEDYETVSIDERLFTILVQDRPEFALTVMRVLAGRLRAMNARA